MQGGGGPAPRQTIQPARTDTFEHTISGLLARRPDLFNTANASTTANRNLGIGETEPNIRNKLRRGKFTGSILTGMFRSNWFRNPPLSVGLLLLAVLAGAETYSRYQDNSPDTDARPRQEAAQHSAERLPVQRPAPDPNPERDEWREEQDLKAQQWMAVWAGFMAFITAAGVGVTTVGVLYVRDTLRATRATLKEAEEATKAAVDAAQAAWATVRETRSGNRAWIDPAPELYMPLRLIDHGINSAVTVNMTNYGRSPALWAYPLPELHCDENAAMQWMAERARPNDELFASVLAGVGEIVPPSDSRPVHVATNSTWDLVTNTIAEENRRRALIPAPPLRATHLFLAVVVRYHTPGDSVPKFTGKIWQLFRDDPDTLVLSGVEREEIPAAEIGFRPMPFGQYLS